MRNQHASCPSNMKLFSRPSVRMSTTGLDLQAIAQDANGDIQGERVDPSTISSTLPLQIPPTLIPFNRLARQLPVGLLIVAENVQGLLGFEVSHVCYQQSQFGKMLAVQCKCVKDSYTGFTMTISHASCFEYEGRRAWTELPFRPMTQADFTKLHARGLIYRELGQKHSFKEYSGALFLPRNVVLEAHGRVMVDEVSWCKVHGHASNHENGFEGHSAAGGMGETVPDHMLHLCWPTVHAFCFATKLWGLVSADRVRPVQFRDDAFDLLVLEPSRKELVASLVRHCTHTFEDIIQGKGGGCVFLLHGLPGTGKTLTAEAVAEVLHRPLYCACVGDFGTNPSELERALSQILSLCCAWNATLLIDEADIFLECRSTNDIVRNAMVSVFLRLLEYHQGVLFLTTNRVRALDPAFHSRISLALEYEALSVVTRECVWKNLLIAASNGFEARRAELHRLEASESSKAAGSPSPRDATQPEELVVIDVQAFDLAALAQTELNGRQIKSCIRLACALAAERHEPLRQQHLERTSGLVMDFTRQLTVHTYDKL